MTTYGVGNPGRGLEIGTNMWLDLTTCMYFFFLYCIVQYQISHAFASIRCFIFHNFSQKPLKNCLTMPLMFYLLFLK
jgi:hypothetical protein